MFRVNTSAYKLIAIILFLILGVLQYLLIYNTYKLKNEQLFSNEKEALKNLYQQSIRNELIFPGANVIIDKYVGNDKFVFSNFFKKADSAFKVNFIHLLKDSLLAELRNSSIPEPFTKKLISKSIFKNNIRWGLYIDSIVLTRDGINYETFFSSSYRNKSSKDDGKISGTLNKRTSANLISILHVSSGFPNSYAIVFSLHADVANRSILVLQKMLPTLLLSLLSILGLIAIFYFTFRNWIRQKKMAEMRTDFVNSITHEFHTPLSSIIVANRSLQNDKLSSDKQMVASLTGVISRQSTRLKTLFDQVLDITLMNEASLQKQEVIFENLIADVVNDYRIQLEDDKVIIDLDEAHTNTRIDLDPFWTTTMIINLLDNGVKYNNNEQKLLNIKVLPFDKLLELHINDNGIGIPNEISEKVFDKFYRNTEHIKSNAASGLGLGLYYVKLCVDAHNWNIRIDLNKEGGTNFIIQIPSKP